jgi:hypothetical protein
MYESPVCGCQAYATSTGMGANPRWDAITYSQKTVAQQLVADNTQKCYNEMMGQHSMCPTSTEVQ